MLRSLPNRLHVRIARLITWALCFTCLSVCASAADQVVRVDPVVRDGRLSIEAEVVFTLSEVWHRAMEKGVPAYFTADLEVVQPRWWWFDKTLIETQKTWKITYNALTRQWRVGSGEMSLPESSLEDALVVVRRIQGWVVANTADIPHNTPLLGRLRLRLDTSSLAQPFQFDTFNPQGWSLETPWKNFTFSIVVGPSDPS